MDIMSPYNIILGPNHQFPMTGRSTQYLTLKYLLLNDRVGTIRGDQQMAHKCYQSILETTREELTLVNDHLYKVPNTDIEGWYPTLDAEP